MTWRVMRQDDNGNIFLVKDGLTEDAARALADTFEARGHKQLYWVESSPGLSPEERGPGDPPDGSR